MQLAHEALVEDVAPARGGKPRQGSRDVGLLPLVELLLRRDVRREQPLDLVRVERRRARRMLA